MANYGNKTIYVRDWSKWDAVTEIAKSQGMSMSQFIEQALDNALKPDENALKIYRIKCILEE